MIVILLIKISQKVIVNTFILITEKKLFHINSTSDYLSFFFFFFFFFSMIVNTEKPQCVSVQDRKLTEEVDGTINFKISQYIYIFIFFI